jgi:small-conductance mechanosensitive channel
MLKHLHSTHMYPRVAAFAIVALAASAYIWAQEKQIKPSPAGGAQRTVTWFGVDGKIEAQQAESPSDPQDRTGLAERAKEQAKQNVEDKKKLQLELDGLLRDGKLERAAAVQRELQMRHLRWQLEKFDNFVAENFELREGLVDEIDTLRKEVKELRKEVQSLRESLKK